MSRRTFVAVRLPGLVIIFLLAFCVFGYTGWHILNPRDALKAEAQIRQRMREIIQSLSAYHARFKTNLTVDGVGVVYQVEIWKGAPERYRLEMVRLEDGKQSEAQVVVYDGAQAYLYNSELSDFYPVHDLGRTEIPYLVLEDYWNSLIEAAQFNYLTEEGGSRHSYYLVEVFPPEPHRYRVRELIWLETDCLLPVRIEVYDAYDSLTQVTVFEIIELNPPLEATLFQVEVNPALQAGD